VIYLATCYAEMCPLISAGRLYQVGTYNAAVLARRHGVKMMIVAPETTIDIAIPDGTGYALPYLCRNRSKPYLCKRS
jgi:hypothetical protein